MGHLSKSCVLFMRVAGCKSVNVEKSWINSFSSFSFKIGAPSCGGAGDLFEVASPIAVLPTAPCPVKNV